MDELNLVPGVYIQDPPQGPKLSSTFSTSLLNTHFAPTKLDYIHNPDISCSLYILEDGDLKGLEPP